MAGLPTRLKRFAGEIRRRRVGRVAVVYVAVAFVLLQAGEIIFPALRLPEWSLTLLVVLAAFGFPIAVVLAWAFDISPEGVVRTEPRPRSSEPPGVAAPLPLAGDNGGGRHPRKTVAVLPFKNMGGDSDNEYFAEGIHEDVIASLARIRDLKVVSRTSVMGYRDTGKNVRAIGRELGVGSVLEGSVRRSVGRVRIVAQLVDAHTDMHLWAETYDRSLEDIFEIQTDVAQHIAKALEATLTEKEVELLEKKPTSSVEAYDLYLRGRHAWNERTERGLDESVDFLRKALDRDPSFALARAGLADAYATLGIYNARASADVMPLAEAEATRALELDPDLAEALTARACVRSLYRWQWANGEEDFRRAIRSNPRYPTAHHWYAMNHLTLRGRLGEARSELREAAELDPLSPVIQASLGFVAFLGGEHEEAEATYVELLRAHPDFAMGHFFLGQALEGMGRYADAVRSLEQAGKLRGRTPEVLAALGQVYGTAGETARARALRDALVAESERRYVSPTRLAQVSVALGEVDAAFAWLERAFESRAADLAWIAVLPACEGLRGDPRYGDLIGRIGLA